VQNLKYSNMSNVYSNYGLVTEEDTYDWGHGTPGGLLAKATTAYGSWNGSTCAPVGNFINSLPCDVVSTDGTYVSSETRSTRDSHGNATTTAKWTGSTWLSSSATYNANGTVSVITDVNGQQTTYSYGGCNPFFATQKSQSVTSGFALVTQYSWDCNGAVQTSTTDPNGHSVTYSFVANGADPFWRKKSSTDALDNVTNYGYSNFISGVTSAYTSDSMIFNGGASVDGNIEYLDGLGRRSNSQRPQGPGASTYDTVSTSYDGRGRVYKTSTSCAAAQNTSCPISPATSQTYDALNRPYVTTDGGGGTVTKTYAQNDMLEVIGPTPTFSRQYEYDALGRLKSVCEILSTGGASCGQNTAANGYLTTYTYSVPATGGGTQLVATQGSQTRTYIRDALGRLIYEKNPESGTTQYFWDSAPSSPGIACSINSVPGSLVKRYDANGNTICYQYDLDGRVSTITYSGPNSTGVNKYFVYDSATVNGVNMGNVQGRLAEAYTATCSTCTKSTDIGYSYNARGETTDAWESTLHSGTYYHPTQNYWANGGIDTLWISTLPAITYTPDGEGRTSTVSASSGQNPVTSTTYNAGSQATNVVFGSGDSDTFTYDGTGRMTQYQYTVNGSTESGTLHWNPNGTLGSFNISDPFNSGDNNQNCTYQYDALERLASAACGSAWSQTFSYDAFGNITKSGSIAWQPGYSPSTNRYILAGTSYDANGNLLNDTFHTYTWDGDGRPLSIDSIGLTYDAFDRMVEQNKSGTFYQIVYTPSGTKMGIFKGGTIQQLYVPLPGGTVAEYYSWGLSDYRDPDWLGSDRLETNASNHAILDSNAYAPFGEPSAQMGNGEISFTGQNKDTVWLQYDFPLRQYDPKQGRWISPDPGGFNSVNVSNPQSWNRYTYVNNNPLSNKDEKGLCDGSGCSADGAQGGSSMGGGFVALMGDWGDFLLQVGTSLQGLPFGQGLNFTVDGFASTPEQAMSLLSASAGQPGYSGKRVTVPENVIFDSDANGGQGLTCEQVCKFKDLETKMEQFYAQIGIQFKTTYSEGAIVYDTGGRIVDIPDAKRGSLNVFVFGGSLPVILNGAWGAGTGAAGIMGLQGQNFAFSFIGLQDADVHTLEHEFAHHFVGNTLGKTGFFKNLFMDTYIDDFVLKDPTKYGNMMRDYSQQILNP